MTGLNTQGRFAGVSKIIRFNVQFYAGSAVGLLLVAVLLMARMLPRWLEVFVLCGAVAIGFWTLSSLLVSWYVYDCSGVTRWAWMPTQLFAVPRRWVNIHAGLDESTLALQRLFPRSEGSVIDIYDPTEMTEPSIARARRMYPATEPFLIGKFDSLPLPDSDRDEVFLLFAAHEVRAPERRTKLLCETARVLRDGGQVVLVEHLRDWANFFAFGPGFLHFHSGRSWRQSIREAGLRIERESNITPFVRCFVLRKASAWS
jgi:ubiquinone/menaquinone biosynthesis C-methylase UbiE